MGSKFKRKHLLDNVDRTLLSLSKLSHEAVDSMAALPKDKTKLKHALAPLFPISRNVGLLPYGKDIIPTVFWQRYSLIVPVAVVLAVISHKIVICLTNTSVLTSVSNGIALVRFGTNIVTILLHTYKMYSSKEELENILKTLILYDNAFIKYDKKYSKYWSSVCLVWGFLSLNLLKIQIPSVSNIVEGLIEAMTIAIVMQYCCFMEVLRCHFRELSNNINDDPKKVMKLVDRHNELLDICASLDGLYSFQQVGISIKIFVRFIVEAYSMIEDILTKNFSPIVMTSDVLLCILPILITYRIAETAEDTQSEVIISIFLR